MILLVNHDEPGVDDRAARCTPSSARRCRRGRPVLRLKEIRHVFHGIDSDGFRAFERRHRCDDRIFIRRILVHHGDGAVAAPRWNVDQLLRIILAERVDAIAVFYGGDDFTGCRIYDD